MNRADDGIAVEGARADVAVVACCRVCDGWLAAMTEKLEARGGRTVREFYRDVAKHHDNVRRVSGGHFRSGAIQSCRCARDQSDLFAPTPTTANEP